MSIQTYFYKMSLTWDFKTFFTEQYPSWTFESLHKVLEENKKHKSYVESRLKDFICSCLPDDCLVLQHEATNGDLTTKFPHLIRPFCSSCQKCFTPYPSHWKGAGYSIYDHHHPLLLLSMIEYTLEQLEKAILCKEKQYDILTNDELQQVVEDTYAYSRTLRRTETDFLARSEGFPEGFANTMESNKKEMEALDFELKSRKLSDLI